MEVKERHLKLIGAVLFAQFYVVWALGFADYAPQLYNLDVLRASAILLVIGLLLMLSGYIKDIAKRAAADKYFRALMIIYFAAVYYVVYSVMMKYYQLSIGASLDTSVYLQSFVSAALYHRLFDSFAEPTIFYNHASPILFLVYPLYLTYPGIPTLMTIQTALATLPAIPLYKLGLRLFGDRRYALLTALAYLLFPWITTYLVGPFEVVILTAPFFALALYNLYMGNRLGYWLSLTLMMTTIEFSPILGFFIGLYILATKLDWLKAKGRVALGIETLAFSLAWLFGDFLMVYYFSHGTINIFQNVWGSALSGPLISITDSIGNAIFHFTTHTGSSSSSSHQAALSLSSVLESLVNNVKTGLHTKVQSTVFLMMPTLFLNLVEPQSLLLLPWLYVMWQTPWGFYYVIWVYYTALVAPAVIVPTIWALRKFRPRIRRALLVAAFIAVTISTLLLNVLSPLSALYFHEPLPNPLQPATTPYDLALIQLNDYVPPNASVSVPASAVPWFSSTRYGWNEHGVPFFGPNGYTKYEVYSPFVPTGYPYGPNFNNYLPYVFNDGAWLLIGPFQRPYSFNYTTTITLSPLTPGQHQYSVATLPGGPLTVNLSVDYTPLQAIEYVTSNLSWLLQQPQGIACGTLPGYFAVLNSSEYIIQPITINETTGIEALTVFGSGPTNGLVNGQLVISRSPVPTNRSSYLRSTSFGQPWWCMPHTWATPITVSPEVTLKPGTYYVIVNMPTTPWQAACTYTPGAPKALVYNGSTLIKQLNCTLNLIMVTNRPAEVANTNASVSISLVVQNSTTVALNKTVTLVAQKPFELPLTYWANLTGSSYQEALVVSVNQSTGLPLPGELSVTISNYIPADSPPIPLIRLHGLNYTAVEMLMPITPGSHQYSLIPLPAGPVKVSLSVNYTPLQTIEYVTSDLPQVLQLPQGIACGTLPGYFALLNGTEYLVQPVTINETATIEGLVVFGSGPTNRLVNGQLVISRSPVPTNRSSYLRSTSFGQPWWCMPHTWATPIVTSPKAKLEPGTYYVIVNMPTTPWQALCTYIPGAPKALVYNGSTLIKQLNCTLNLIMVTNRPANLTNASSNITISLLGRTITISPQRPTQQALTFEANVTQRMSWETLVVNASEVVPGNLTIRVNTYVPGEYPPIKVPWYLVPAYGNAPVYVLLALALASLFDGHRRARRPPLK
ncbi:MAG: DUF2079 domain-containing protein [Acidilobus sp.]|jgi:uncharacterized membrane protein|nr:DUF2079 domain-containing protein [Acidilobus sp.]